MTQNFVTADSVLVFTAAPLRADYDTTEVISEATIHYPDRDVVGRYVSCTVAQHARYLSFGNSHTAFVQMDEQGNRWTVTPTGYPLYPITLHTEKRPV